MAKPDVISITIEDQSKKTSVLSLYVGSGFVAAPANTAWSAFLNDLEVLQNGRIKKISRAVNVPLTGYGLALTEPDVLSNVQKGARLSFATAFPSYPGFTIPCYNEIATLVNTNRIDPEQINMADLIAQVIAMGVQDAHGEDVTIFQLGYETYAGVKAEEG